MKTFWKVVFFLLLLALAVTALAATTYVDNEGLGSPVVQPQVVSATPAQPYACAAGQRGRVIYVDDTDDGAEAYLCFCGVDADGGTYIWMKAASPATNCF